MVDLIPIPYRSFGWGAKNDANQAALNAAKTEVAEVTAIAETVAEDKFNEVVAAPNDAVVEALVVDSGSATAAALNSTYAPRYASATTAANTHRLLSRLRRGVADASVLVISDSTANASNEWAYLALVALGARFPEYTVTVSWWNETTNTEYQAATTVQTGTGIYTLRLWMCGKSGEVPGYVQGSRWSAAVVATNPDLVFVNHGHNMGDPTGAAWKEQLGRNVMASLTEEIAATFPQAGIVLIAQNPSTLSGRLTWQAIKANAWEDLAALRGYGFIDVHQAFVDDPRGLGVLLTDGTHPSDAGSQLWADVVGEALVSADLSALVPSPIPPLLVSSRNYLQNSDFSSWAGTNPDNWTPNASAATAKDTTNFESGTYGAKVTGNATSGGAQIEQSFNLTTRGLRNLRGQLVTVAARVFVPASNTQTVRVSLLDSTGSAGARSADVSASTRDRYVWVFVTKRLDAAATDATVRLLSRTSGTAAVEATFDRCYMVQGALPLCGS